MSLKRLLTLLSFLIIASSAIAQKGMSVTQKDLKKLIGCWQATLAHKGTIVRKPYTVNAKVMIKRFGIYQFIFSYSYSNAQGDNSTDTFNISKDGHKINGAGIIQKQYLRNNSLLITTEAVGIDKETNKEATFRYTYILGKRRYNFKKEVRHQKQEEWMLLEDYKYAGKPC